MSDVKTLTLHICQRKSFDVKCPPKCTVGVCVCVCVCFICLCLRCLHVSPELLRWMLSESLVPCLPAEPGLSAPLSYGVQRSVVQ